MNPAADLGAHRRQRSRLGSVMDRDEARTANLMGTVSLLSRSGLVGRERDKRDTVPIISPLATPGLPLLRSARVSRQI